MQRLTTAMLFAALFAIVGTTADAKPIVQLKLQGAIVERDAKGNEKLAPLTDAELKPGQIVRYDVVATNAGSEPASKFVPAARVPAGTEYESGSASVSGTSRIEFSIDGGKTWATKPLVTVETSRGAVEKAAPTAMYTMLRWVADKDLAPNQTASYSYAVRVK